MGEVYRARDLKLDREVAIKVLPDPVASNPERLARFRREAQVLASLNHPNIATIYGLEEVNGVLALVLELVDGATLAVRLAEGPIPIVEALRLAQQISAALEAAHERGIVHRDLKPANVMVKADGTVKILDFGLAKLTEVDPASVDAANSPTFATGSTQPGMILGTAAYMAPEQAKGKAVDKRADIWALGAVLYEMLTGKRAFPGHEVPEIIAGIIKEEPRWDAVPAETPPSICRLLRRCLAKDLGARLHDMADVRLEIEDALAASQRELVTAGAASTIRVSRRRLPVAVLLIVVAILALGAALGVRFLSSGVSPKEGGTPAPKSPPLVIMMDSPYPARVYDAEILAANGTNADVISDILSDLSIRRQKEAVGPEWHRDEEIRQFRPDLIIIHYSAFNREDSSGPRERLKILIKFFADTPTKFLIYSRLHEADLKANLATLLTDLYVEHPGLKERVRAFGVLDYGPPLWLNNLTSSQLKLVVKEMLRLP
jgi:hypothetical protein